MKNFISVFILIFIIAITGYSQNVAINASGNPAASSAILDVSSTSKGMLVPRMSTLQRIMIINPAQGLLVYDMDTRTFWFYDGAWNQISGGGGSIPTGPASGDLNGSYPSPNVVKIQNLDVANGVPFDKQVMKWDALANNWKGRNDSLFLPYNVAFGNSTKLFGIQNNNTTGGSSAICGKSGSVGSGLTPSSTMGVWGDNATGLGVVGTSNTGIGTYGFSFGNHGVYGYSTLANFAGVCGTHANANGIGVLGEVQTTGKGVYGRSIGTSGKAGFFANTNTSNADTALVVTHAGFGTAGYFNTSNPINGNAIVEVSGNGQGDGIYSQLSNTGNYNHANFRAYNQSLGGYAFYGQSELGTSCYLNNTGSTNNSLVLDARTSGLGTVGSFTITNASNVNNIINGTSNGLGSGLSITLTNAVSNGTGINLTHSGTGNGLVVNAKKGKAAIFSNTDGTNNLNVMEVNNIGTNQAANFVTTNSANSAAVVNVNTNGTGKGIQSTISNSSSNAAAVYASSSGANGIQGFAFTTGVSGQSTTLTGGVGVFGQSSLNSGTGIGVKGISYSTNLTCGAVTGIGNADGVAIYGESLGGGIAISGKTTSTNRPAIYGVNDGSQGVAIRGSATGTDGIGVYGEAGVSSSNSIAGYFKNSNTANTRNTVTMTSNGLGKTLYVENINAGNNTDLISARNYGTGNFLLLADNGGATKTMIANNGNITTDGTITVKSNKGIIRNSSSTQLRTEIMTASIPAGSLPHYDDQFNGAIVITLNYGTAFFSAPSVYIGNVLSGSLQGLTAIIQNVTSSSCELWIANYTPYGFNFGATSLKIIAIGAE